MAKPVVLHNEGERVLFRHFMRQGLKEEAAAQNARLMAHSLSELGARVFAWFEIFMAVLFVGAVSLVGGLLAGFFIGLAWATGGR